MKADSQRKIRGHLCAAWKCQLTMWPPPICLRQPPENKPLHINYTRQHRNAIERLGIETPHNLLCLLKKDWRSSKMSIHSPRHSVMCKTFILHQSGIISCCLAVWTVELCDFCEKRLWIMTLLSGLNHHWGLFVLAATVWTHRHAHMAMFSTFFQLSSWERELKMESRKEGFIIRLRYSLLGRLHI